MNKTERNRLERNRLKFNVDNYERKWISEGFDDFRYLEFYFNIQIENIGLDRVFVEAIQIKPIDNPNFELEYIIPPINIPIDNFTLIDVGDSSKFEFSISVDDRDIFSGKEISYKLEAIRSMGLRVKIVDEYFDEIFSDIIKPEILSDIKDPGIWED